VADTLYRSLMEGLEQSGELTLVRLSPGEQVVDLQAFGQSLGVAGLAVGQFTQSPDGARIEMQLLDVLIEEVIWSQAFDWDPTQIIEISNAIANGVLEAMALPALSRKKFTGTDSAQASPWTLPRNSTGNLRTPFLCWGLEPKIVSSGSRLSSVRWNSIPIIT